MKPTEQNIKEMINKSAKKEGITGFGKTCFSIGFREAISQMKTEWVAWDIIKSDKELRQKFNDYNDELIMLQFDDGSIMRYDEDYNRAEIIRAFYTPTPQ